MSDIFSDSFKYWFFQQQQLILLWLVLFAIVLGMTLWQKSKKPGSNTWIPTAIVGLILLLAGALLIVKREVKELPSAEQANGASVTVPGEVAEDIRKAGNELREITQERTVNESGQAHLNLNWNPIYGWIPDYQDHIQMDELGVLSCRPMGEWDKAWQAKHPMILQQAREAYEVLQQQNFALVASPFEPFLALRCANVQTNNVKTLLHAGGIPLVVKVYIEGKVVLVKIDTRTAYYFDASSFWRGKLFGPESNAHAIFARIAKECLEARGVNPLADTLHFKVGIANLWDACSDEGQEYLEALKGQEKLNPILYGERADYFLGNTEEANLILASFGPYAETEVALPDGKFVRLSDNPILALQVIWFLASHPCYRYREDPNSVTSLGLTKMQDEQRQYAFLVASTWMELAPSNELGRGSYDPSETLIKFMQLVSSQACPIRGQEAVLTHEQMMQILVDQKMLPAFEDYFKTSMSEAKSKS